MLVNANVTAPVGVTVALDSLPLMPLGRPVTDNETFVVLALDATQVSLKVAPEAAWKVTLY